MKIFVFFSLIRKYWYLCDKMRKILIGQADVFLVRKLMCLLASVVLLCCCSSSSDANGGDRLNDAAYYWHYRDVGRVETCAREVLRLPGLSDRSRAEAYTHLAFVSIVRMDYDLAWRQLDSLDVLTDNQVELLVGDVLRMRLCQRESRNKDFYDYRERAERRMVRIDEELDGLSARERGRLLYARSEYDIVRSTYYYYMGLGDQARAALAGLDVDGELRADTAQYLSYLYNVGSGGIVTGGSQWEVNQEEFEYLLRCYQLASEYDYVFWVANSLQALSELLQTKGYRERLLADNGPAVMYLNEAGVADSLLAGNLAERSLHLFETYGDVYQRAGAWRTLAGCYWELGAYASSLECLDSALSVDVRIEQAPDLVSSIREQMSVVYSALGDKGRSDFNRNIYLDLQERTRQDRYLESRVDHLRRSSSQLTAMIVAVVVLIVLVLLLLFVFSRLRRRRDGGRRIDDLLLPLERWKVENDRRVGELKERYEDICEEKERRRLHIRNGKRQSVEQRAKVSLVNSVTPFIDRILNEVGRLSAGGEGSVSREERFNYVVELTEEINEYNSLLTDWIQLRQGVLSLHIESFALQPLFEMVARGRMGFSLKGVALDVQPTDDWVKADKVLTLFMINTIADNARKFTSSGGRVTIGSRSTEEYVEVSIEDTGKGMSAEQLENLFKLNVEIHDSGDESHGFGLLNCRGIIEKYRKMSSLFSVCTIGAESREGEGSRFFFRLPKGVRRMWLTVVWLLGGLLGALPAAAQDGPSRYEVVTPANKYADKAYYANIRGEYAKTLLYADSARMCLNDEYRKLKPHGTDTLKALGSEAGIPPEISWFREGLNIDYTIITDIRNESAVAALALHEWDVYRYNNRIYTQLYKELSADNTLDSYVRIMQQSETNKNVAIVILVLLLLSIFPAYYVLYYRHEVHFRYCVERIGRINDILLSGTSDEEKLREIGKISTDRFPSSLKNVVEQIMTTLRQNVEASDALRGDIELAGDELHRYQLEDEKLYVSNSVLDNCLSTLKHETMYYPSRIRQLVDDEARNLQSISETASYYKELYSLLSMQAMRQVESVKPVCKAVSLESVFGKAYDVVSHDSSLRLLGDADILSYLFEILQKQSGEKRLSARLTEKRGRYVEVRVRIARLSLTDEECLALFTPRSMAHIPYLLCRQIVRDTGESTNGRGCGITAERHPDGGTDIVVTLVKA